MCIAQACTCRLPYAGNVRVRMLMPSESSHFNLAYIIYNQFIASYYTYIPTWSLTQILLSHSSCHNQRVCTYISSNYCVCCVRKRAVCAKYSRCINDTCSTCKLK